MLSSIRKYVKPKPISRQNQKLTQQHNWKKSSSSPRKASVLYSFTECKIFRSVWNMKTRSFSRGNKNQGVHVEFSVRHHPLRIPIPMLEKKIWIQQENLYKLPKLPHEIP